MIATETWLEEGLKGILYQTNAINPNVHNITSYIIMLDY